MEMVEAAWVGGAMEVGVVAHRRLAALENSQTNSKSAPESNQSYMNAVKICQRSAIHHTDRNSSVEHSHAHF